MLTRNTLEFRVTALEQLQELIHAPSVQMHDVPKESIGHHLGFTKDEEGWDGLDERLARKSPSHIPVKPLTCKKTNPTQNMQDMSTTSRNPPPPPPNLRMKNPGTRMTPLIAGDANPTTVSMGVKPPPTAPTSFQQLTPPTPPMEALSTGGREHE